MTHRLCLQLRVARLFFVVALGVLQFSDGKSAPAAGPIEFNRDIRPLLSDKCFACHGFDSKHREADLRLDMADSAYADHDGNRAVVPGDLAASSLWKRINSTDADEMMPPPDSNKKLNDAEKQLLKQWIEQGAKYQKHWAFEPPVEAAVPAIESTGVPLQNPIDNFIAARLKQAELKLSPEADRPTLIRRVAFTLTGLPPTIAEVDAYLADSSPSAYEAMVDRYLASPHYGEEMARHWLDVARYADTHGLHLDNERQMWAYRDWVIGAFAKNLPFDQFTVAQIAGDLVPNASTDQLVATGFNRCNVTSSEGGSIGAEYLFRYAVDRASTTAETWLGLTVGCAVCHDHKFDPISQREFYSLYAFFNSAADPAMDGNSLLTRPVMKLETPDYRGKLDVLTAEVATRQQAVDKLAATVTYVDPVTASPAVAAADVETVWMEDAFPAGAHAKSSGHPTKFVGTGTGDPVFSGEKSLKRSHSGLSQDYYEGGAPPLEIPGQARLVAYVYIDPVDPPKAIMLQYHTGAWKHRAVWGDYAAIPWGAVNTTERVHIGPLPALGEWVRLEVPAEKLGLTAGDSISGFACTQQDGTVYWDKLGVVGRNEAAGDAKHSFVAWWKAAKGKDTPGIAAELAPIAKAGPDKKHKPEDEKRLLAFYLRTVCVDTKPQFATLNAELTKAQKALDAHQATIPSTFIYNDMPKPRDSFVMARGAYDKPGEKVMPDVPAILPPLKKADAAARATRLDLANWLVSPEHPLTARVTVNRFWQQFFGTGLVKTSFDFGSQGEVPSHPELLDYLAVQFRGGGWDVKRIVRMMLTSATFRQASYVSREIFARDPENRLYAHGPRFRLDAEQIRDNALFVSGLANLTIGGRGVRPYQPANIWEPVAFSNSNTGNYKPDTGPSLYRRSIYTFLKRTAPPPFMANFDAPNREQFCTKRERSNTPLQALQLMNDVQHVEAARALAQRMLTDGGSSPEERIRFAYRVVLSRTPEPEELALVQAELAAHLARYQKDTAAAQKLIAHGESKPRAELVPAELAAFTLVANMILNLDETLTRN